jgi:two-component system, NarL family, response regulator DegU
MENKKGKIRLLVIEDNRILREGIIAMLKPHKDINIIAESETNENTILKIQKLKPDVILLDLGLRNRSSLELVGMVKREFKESKIIVMDLVPVQADILQFVKAGASGFILKSATIEEFLTTIRAVAEGEKVLPPYIKDSVFTQIIEYAIKSGKTKLIDSVKMSKKEKEIINLICDGITNNTIAQELHMSDNNVKSHIHNILEKLALRARLEPSKKNTGLNMFKTFSENISLINK